MILHIHGRHNTHDYATREHYYSFKVVIDITV